MSSKSKKIILIQRLLFWVLYLLSGFILYSKNGYLFSFLITFAKIIYPLSIFWLQLRIKKIGNLLPIDSSMPTSKLWFNLLPVFSSFLTLVITYINLFLFLLFDFI